MTTKHITVTRAPGTDRTPMVKLANQLLAAMGFAIGAPIEVVYQRGVITLRIVNYANSIQSPSGPFSLPAASDSADAGEVDGHPRRDASSPSDASKAVSGKIQPLRLVLSGSWHYVSP